ncbi:MAG: radical SAM protein [Planctomycetota bacterium]
MVKGIQTVSGDSILEEISGRADRLLIPLTVLLEPTRRCNLGCRHCYRIEDAKRTEMSTQRIENLLDELRQAGCLFLTISGGEPLLHPDFLQICRKAHSLNMALNIFTNGLLISESLADRLSQLNILGVHLSVYGATPETHDAITGQKGSYDKTINAALILKQNNISVRFKYIIINANFLEYREMLRVSEQLRIPYDIDPVITPKDDGDATPTKYALSDEELETIYKDMSPSLTGAKPSDACSSGRSYCAINSYGDLYPCIQLPAPAGNIISNSFIDIWNNSEWLNEIRHLCSYDKEPCRECNLKPYCRQCPGLNYLENNTLYGISRETCRHSRAIKKAVAGLSI